MYIVIFEVALTTLSMCLDWPDQTICNARRLTVSTKGKKYCLEGLKLAELCKNDVERQSFIYKPKKATKNKLCQITTPIQTTVQDFKNQKFAMSTDTTQDRPCCCVITEPELADDIPYPETEQISNKDSSVNNLTSQLLTTSIFNSQVRKDYPIKTTIRNRRQIEGNQKKTVTIKSSLIYDSYPVPNVKTRSDGCQFTGNDTSYLLRRHNEEEIKCVGQTSPSCSGSPSGTTIEHGPRNCEKKSSFSSKLSGKYKSLPSSNESVQKEDALIEVMGPLGGYANLELGGTFTQAGIRELRSNTAVGVDTDLNYEVSQNTMGDTDIDKAHDYTCNEVEENSNENIQELKENYDGECSYHAIDVKADNGIKEENKYAKDEIKDVKIGKDVTENNVTGEDKDIDFVKINNSDVCECPRDKTDEIFKQLVSQNQISECWEEIQGHKKGKYITKDGVMELNEYFHEHKDVQINKSSIFKRIKNKTRKLFRKIKLLLGIKKHAKADKVIKLMTSMSCVTDPIPEFIYDDCTDIEGMELKQFAHLRSDLCQITSGFKCYREPKKKEAEPELSLEDAIRYYAILYPEVLSTLLEPVVQKCICENMKKEIYEDYEHQDETAPEIVAKKEDFGEAIDQQVNLVNGISLKLYAKGIAPLPQNGSMSMKV